MRRLRRLWSTLETIPGLAAERLEWQRYLLEEWLVAEPLLRRTGQVVEQVWCPSVGGDGCPRRVVHHADGRIVAVCGDRPKRCDPLLLSPDDIAVFEIDWRKLAAALAHVFDIDATSAAILSPGVYRLGDHLVVSGAGFPAVLWVAQVFRPLPSGVLQSLLDGSRPTVFLTPTRQSLTAELLDALKVRGGIGVVLLETVGADDRGALTGLSPAKVIFASVRERLIQQRKMKTPEHRFPTPLGTRWEHVTIRFITQQQVDIRARGQSGVYEFTQVGMADMRSKKEPKPDVQWQLLIDFAENGGELTWRDSQAERRNAKRKELLAKGLKKFFGIEDEPFKPLPNGMGWRARFTLIPEVDRPERNFAATPQKTFRPRASGKR